ncbi:hypothetical protein NDU88_004857 [Pleurodeles waltl]|uniref:Transmembrane protein n=1 Tax=Pleurodeles waltl TaxID=8319 RepID=A0AAV7M9D4_PLEWA|nr:hypothetical protein NDU88_004857 [Pleurodeles waltl]
MESCDQIAVRSTDVSEHVVYSVPRREPPSASSFTVAPFARTASGCFNNADNDGSGSSSSMSSVHGPRRLLGWLKRTYFVFPWNYFWLFLAVMTILLWLGFVVTFFLIIHGHFLPDRSDIEHVETVLKPHFSSHMVRRDLSTVNISAIPVPDGIVWDKVMFDIYGPTELIQIPYVLKLSMNDIVIPGIVSDDWDVKTVDSMLTDLQYYTVYDDEDAYQFRDNHGDMFCYNYYGYHFIHKASSPKPMFNYVQWEHCSTPPQGSSKTYYDKFAYFAGHDPRPRVPRKKRFLYEVLNEIWKLSQQEAAARLRQIDQENLMQTLSVVDNGMHTLSERVYTIDSIVSSAIDIIKSDVSSLYHGQSQTLSMMQLGWTLQTLKAGRVPWQHVRAREIFISFNLTRQQQLMAKKEATYVMLNIEKLEKLPFTVAEIPSAEW